MQNDNIHRLLSVARSVRQVDSGSWTCYCPIHESNGGVHNNSLSVLAPDDGKIIVNCHNGCSPKDVVYAFGLTWSDCFPPKNHTPSSKITATYDYEDEDGVLRFQVCRIEPGADGRKKDFRQRQPDGAGDWTWKTKGLQKFPYRLKELAAADKSHPVFVVEGEKQVDYLRSLGLVATCNPGGAGKWLKSYSKHFDGRDVVVVPDCDPPNEKTGKIVGAAHAKDVADSLIGVAKSIHVIELPDCQPKWGLDDWLQSGRTLGELSEILKDAAPWGPESSLTTQVPVGAAADPNADPIAYDRKILNEIGIVYCSETESTEIEIFSSQTRKFSTIKEPAKLTYSKLLQIAGPSARAKVSQGSGDDDGKPYSMSEVRNALGMVAGAGKRGSEKLGQGIWRLNDETVMVNGGHIAIYSGEKIRKDLSAVYGDHVFDLGGCEEWFDFEEVQRWINQDSRDWIESAMAELVGILSQWCYKIPDPNEDPSICAEIVASLIVASWIQSFWMFRPMTFLLGESNSGKSTLFQLLIGEESNPLDVGLMGSLAIHSSNQSAAGLRQSAERSSRPVFVDEFEKGKHRAEILELLRGASRGSQSIRGTAGQKAVTTKLAFMAWAASTESGLVKQVDQNRWIKIQLATPPNNMMGKLKLPSPEDMTTLRNKLVAASVVIGNCARAGVERLMSGRPKDIDHRICQIFAVPAAVFQCMAGLPDDVAAESFGRMLRIFDSEALEKDQDSTLDMILTSKIRCGHTERSLLSLIQLSQNQFAPGSVDNEELLATHGIKIISETKNGIPRKFVFFVHKTVTRELLRGSPLEGVKIDELLLRLPGCVRDLRRISGKPMRGVTVPLEVVLPPEQPEMFQEV